MPPVQASYDNQELAWQAAPYRPRSRQRTTSLRGDSLRGERPSSIGSIHSLNGDRDGLPSMSMPNIPSSASLGSLNLGQHRTSFTDYTSPLRHGSTASSSDGSGLSRAYSFLSNSTAPTSIGVHGESLLSESPEALHSKYLLQRHHSQQEFHHAATTADLHQGIAGRLERSFSSDLGNHARRQNSYGDLNSLPLPRGVHPDAFAPLQLDSATARELDDEPPLTLPQPWAVERQRTNSNSYGLGRRPSLSVLTGSSSSALDRSYLSSSTSSMTLGATADRLSNSNVELSGRSHSSSLPRPSLSSSLSTSSTSAFYQQSVVPPDMPKSKFVEGLVGAACIAVEVVWKVPDSHGNIITPHRSPDGSSSSSSAAASVLPLRHFIKEVLRRSKSTCSTLQCALYYIHKSRDVIRERVRAAEEAKQELIRIRASGQVDASTWNGSTLPSPPYGVHDRSMNGRGSPSSSPTSTSERVAYLLAKVRDPVLCGRRMFLAALICASKFLQDKTFANKAWAKISSLSIPEINANEKALLQVLDYNLFVNPDLFRNWTRRLQDLAEKQDRKNVLASSSSSPIGGASLQQRALLGAHHLAATHRDGLERSASDYLPSPAETMCIQAKPHLHSAHSASSILPRPQLAHASRFASSSFPALHSGSGLRNFASSLGSCSDFARSLGGDDWSGAGSDNMVA